ncbi:MAG: hypothetical protein GY705_19350, partial [Bacteroidetes bacterium]|nr:hypothetical protein [Bacteroidota bacterium]
MFRLFNLTSCILISAVLFFAFLLYDFQQKQRPNIILLTVDSLHRDLINDFNTPSLFKAAEKSFKSPHHGVLSGWTGTSIVSLLRDLTSFSTGVHTRGQSISTDLSLLFKDLAADGYKVEGIQSFMTMDLYKNYGLIINDPGYDLRFWLADKIVSEQPFFLWYHYLNIHLPNSA